MGVQILMEKILKKLKKVEKMWWVSDQSWKKSANMEKIRWVGVFSADFGKCFLTPPPPGRKSLNSKSQVTFYLNSPEFQKVYT